MLCVGVDTRPPNKRVHDRHALQGGGRSSEGTRIAPGTHPGLPASKLGMALGLRMIVVTAAAYSLAAYVLGTSMITRSYHRASILVPCRRLRICGCSNRYHRIGINLMSDAIQLIVRLCKMK